jgi:hypothetical protein
MAVPTAETTRWLGLLVAGLTMTVFGTTFPNRFNQQRQPRSHNGFRLFNESLARSQLALFNYFLAVAITAELGSHARAKFLLVPIIVMATYSYVAHVGASVELGEKLARTHKCSEKCVAEIPFKTSLWISARYVVSTLVLTGTAWYYAYIAGNS